MTQFLKKIAIFVLVSAMLISDIPMGFIIGHIHNRNVVDVLYQAYQSGTLSEHFGPQKAYATGATYTEVQNFKCNARSTWTDMNLSGFGVPANAVVEMMISNEYLSDEQQGGIRANGSALARLMDLNEAEGNGTTATDSGNGGTSLVMHVQADANSIVECFSENPDIVTFKILGWWTGVSYTERFDTLNAAGAAGWEDENLSGFGVNAGEVVEVVAENSATAAASEIGIRTDGSALERRVDLGEAESGGDVVVTMNAVPVGDNAVIEIYEEVIANTSFRLVGYWTTVPGTYTELFQTIAAPGSDATWTDSDLSGYGVDANDIAEVVLANGAAATHNGFGVRTNGSSVFRATELPEAENTGRASARMHVKADASSIIEIYHEDVSDTTYEFQLVGYWDQGDYTEKYSFACNGRNRWTDMDLSVLGVPANAVVEMSIGNQYYNDEQVGGVRANGSAITRSMDISEAEGSGSVAADAGNGISYMVMHVQADANSIVECFAENPDTIIFEVLGYWTNVAYTERFDTLNAAGAAGWEDENLSGFGVNAGEVVEVVAENSATALASYAGIRTDGSALERQLDITEAEPGGVRLLTMNAVAVGANAVIDIYEEVIANTSFRLVGYWTTPPGTYTELFATISAPVADNTWVDKDLSGNGVGANDIVEIVFANGNETTDNRFGARTNGSTIERTMPIVESEDASASSADTNRMLSRIHVQTDTASTIEIVHQDVSDTVYEFQLVGYWAIPPTTFIGPGSSEPSNVTIGPGAGITDLGNFELRTTAGSDTMTDAIITLGPAGAYNNIAQVDITNTSNVAQCTATTSLFSNTVTFPSSTCSLAIGTSSTTYKIRITPKSHANMPAPASGASYATVGVLTSLSTTNSQVGSDTGSATVTIDNASPASATSVSGVAGDEEVTLDWTVSSGEYSTSTILRWTAGSAGTEVPVEGTAYTPGDTVVGTQTATVACVLTNVYPDTSLSKSNGTGGDVGCLTTALTNGTTYYYKVFQQDAYGNYDTGTNIDAFTPNGVNSAPVINSVSLNSEADIVLNEGTGVSVEVVASGTDAQGGDTVAIVTSTIWRTGVANGHNCAANDNNCYKKLATNNCVFGEPSGNNWSVTCTFNIWYVAEPSSGDEWLATLAVTDSGGLIDTADSSGLDVGELLALNVTALIDYDSVSPDSDTADTNEEIIVTNTGNVDIDPKFAGQAMSCSTGICNGQNILVGNQKYSDSAFTYADGGTALTGTPTYLNLSLNKPTSTTTPVTDIVYWGLGIPSGTAPGAFSGTNSTTAAVAQ